MIVLQNQLYKVRTSRKVDEVRVLDFLCLKMTGHGPKSLKNFEFLNFKFSCQSNGVFSFGYFYKIGFD